MTRLTYLGVSVAIVVCALTGSKSSSAADSQPADVLPLHSHWSGTQGADPKHLDTHARPCKFKVTARDDDHFTAEYECNGGSLRVKGTINADGSFECVPTDVLKGTWEKNILQDKWTGTDDGKTLIFNRLESTNGGTRRSELKIERGGEKK